MNDDLEPFVIPFLLNLDFWLHVLFIYRSNPWPLSLVPCFLSFHSHTHTHACTHTHAYTHTRTRTHTHRGSRCKQLFCVNVVIVIAVICFGLSWNEVWNCVDKKKKQELHNLICILHVHYIAHKWMNFLEWMWTTVARND